MSVRAALMALRTDLRTPADYRRAAEELRREAMKLERLAAAIGGDIGEDLASIAAQLRSAARRYAEAITE